MRHFGRRVGSVVLAAAVGVAFVPALPAAAAEPAAAYGLGDVFLSIAGRQVINEFTPAGAAKRRLDEHPSYYSDLAFDAAGDLLASDSEDQIVEFDPQGHFMRVFADTTADGLPGEPASITVDAAGHVFVGARSPDINTVAANVIREYDSAGNLVDHFTVQAAYPEVPFIDMSADQCTIHYTADRGVLAYNVCTRSQESPVSTSVGGYAVREIPGTGGHMLLAAEDRVLLLDASGAVVRTYQPPYCGCEQLSLDPDGTSFWTAESRQNRVYRIRSSDGRVLKKFNFHSPTSGSGDHVLWGLAVFGQRTAGLDG